MGRRTKAWISAGVLAATLVINWMGATGVINNLSQEEVSNQFPTLITPGPATFGIWGLIYALLIASVVMMIAKTEDGYYGRAIDRITHLFWLSSALNVGWIVAFSYLQLGLSTVLIFGFVIVLALINLRLNALQSGRQWLLPLAFGFYGGWLFIATVVNTAAWLVQREWQGFGIAEPIWATIILVVALALTLGVLLQHRNAIFPIPIAWAYYGIYQVYVAPGSSVGENGLLQTVVLLGAIALAAMAVVQFWRNGYKPFPKTVHA